METKNLIIRETQLDDCRYFADWEVRSDVAEFLTFNLDRSYEEVVREFLVQEQDEDKRQFTIVRKETVQPIGRVSISRIDCRMDSCDITKIYIADPFLRRKGYGKEVMYALLDYCFINLHMERVTLDHFPGNAPAAAFYAKLGFQYEGVARNATKKNGKYYDLHLMSMLRAEYYEKVHVK